MVTATEVRKLKESPEVIRAKGIETIINEKLNHDGRLNVLHPMEFMARLGTLTKAESDFLGRLMEWDRPYFGNINWSDVPTRMLAACSIEESGMDALRELYPAPEEASQIAGRVLDEKGNPVPGAAIDGFWRANGSDKDQDGKAIDVATVEGQKLFWGRVGQMEPYNTVRSGSDGRFSFGLLSDLFQTR